MEFDVPQPVNLVGDLDMEGDINGRTFAVASDSPNGICRIAYKTVLNDKISFAEVKYDGKHWSLPKEIDLYAKATPGQNIALVVDPTDTTKVRLQNKVPGTFPCTRPELSSINRDIYSFVRRPDLGTFTIKNSPLI